MITACLNLPGIRRIEVECVLEVERVVPNALVRARAWLRLVGRDFASGQNGVRALNDCAASREVRPYGEPRDATRLNPAS